MLVNYYKKEIIYLFKLFFFKIFIVFFLTKSYAELIQNRSFECETSVVLSIDKKGELKQFLPGKIYFEISKNTLTFGKLGYITDEEILINWINKDKFYSYQPAQTILFDNGLFHNIIFTYEGITAVQAKCLKQENINSE